MSRGERQRYDVIRQDNIPHLRMEVGAGTAGRSIVRFSRASGSIGFLREESHL